MRACPASAQVVLACGCLDFGVDHRLNGAATEEPPGLMPGGQDVGAPADVELRRSRDGQPDAVFASGAAPRPAPAAGRSGASADATVRPPYHVTVS
jgi:hypothetical protein